MLNVGVIFYMHVGLVRFIYMLRIATEMEVQCTCGVGPMRLLVSRTDMNYMRRFYKCPIYKVWNVVA
jgi:hypothetical protein